MKNTVTRLASFGFCSMTALLCMSANAQNVQEVVFGQEYQIAVGENLKLSYTPSTSGTLELTQNGTYDSFMFDTEAGGEYGNVYDNGYSEIETDLYQLFYPLEGEKTYYYIVTGVEGLVSSVTFNAFYEEGQIIIGKSFPSYQESLTFTPSMGGVLTVVLDSDGASLVDQSGNTQSFLYTDESHSVALTPESISQVAVGLGTGYQLTFNVEANETYYFYNDDSSAQWCEFKFTFEDVAEGELPNPEVISPMADEIIMTNEDGIDILASLQLLVLSWGQDVTVNTDKTASVSIPGQDVPVEIPASIYSLDEDPDGSGVSTTGEWVMIELSEYSDNGGIPVYGKYTITIPEGMVSNADGDVNAEQTFVYLVLEENYNYTLNPDPENEVESISEITITWEGVTSIVANDSDIYRVIEVNNNPLSFEEVEVVGNKVIIPVDDDSNGVTLSIPVGYFFLDDNAINPEIEVAYEVGSAPELTVTPASGSTISVLDQISFSWAGCKVVANEFDDTLMPTLAIDGVEVDAEPMITYAGEAVEGNYPEAILSFGKYTEAGEYTVTIPADYFQVIQGTSQFFNEEIVLTYTVDGSYIEPVGNAIANIITGEDGGVTGVEITWGENEIELNPASNGLVEVTGKTGILEVESEVIDNVLVVTFAEEYIDGGTLSVVVPEGYVLVGDEGAVNAEQTFNLTATGVALVGVDGEFSNIYTIQGVKVNASKASQLPAGLYIINGKKVVIRK